MSLDSRPAPIPDLPLAAIKIREGLLGLRKPTFKYSIAGVEDLELIADTLVFFVPALTLASRGPLERQVFLPASESKIVGSGRHYGLGLFAAQTLTNDT
ncbi:MAG: hypothetical protein KDA90_05270 [Planctomycetaceae bacterium]|nr:hypothetical protein [Planctomycetaceae bacterium]